MAQGDRRGGHPVGNHTYDHVYVLARPPTRCSSASSAPWLIEGRPITQVIRENIAMTTPAMRARIGIEPNGFRTPGGFADGLEGREDIQKMLLDLGFKWCSSNYPAHDAGKPMQIPARKCTRRSSQRRGTRSHTFIPAGWSKCR